jgi:hypothetical protein
MAISTKEFASELTREVRARRSQSFEADGA